VTEEELEEIIEKARVNQSEILDLRFNKLVSLPESICVLTKRADIYNIYIISTRFYYV
jgi:hypothetical protein